MLAPAEATRRAGRPYAPRAVHMSAVDLGEFRRISARWAIVARADVAAVALARLRGREGRASGTFLIRQLYSRRLIRHQARNILCQVKGRAACCIESADSILSTELMISADLGHLGPAELAGVASCLLLK